MTLYEQIDFDFSGKENLMNCFTVYGGTPLMGDVYVSGMKNSAPPIIFATVLVRGRSVLENIPKITDITGALEILRRMGAEIEWLSPSSLSICTDHLKPGTSDPELVRTMRGSLYLLGAELGRAQETQIGAPGGCGFDSRPIDRHIHCFEALGAVVDTGLQGVHATVPAGKLRGTDIFFSESTVGGTVNCILAAVTADGTTTIRRAAKEPHIVDLQNYLNLCGADISGAGTDVITIRGVKELHGCTYRILPDMIEAGTFIVAAAATGGRVTVRDVVSRHLECIFPQLREMGVNLDVRPDRVTVSVNGPLKPTSFVSEPYPGFPTDMQPQLAMLCCLSESGISTVTEKIFRARFQYTEELRKMGANIILNQNEAKIFGTGALHGAKVKSHDLRAGAAMIIAGLAANGKTVVVDEKESVARGYLNFTGKLRSLGANIIEEHRA